MAHANIIFNEEHVLHELSHYLPAQAPLKDFIHHNTLHAFQHDEFFKGIEKANAIFGYNVTLGIDEYRALYAEGKISDATIAHVLKSENKKDIQLWKEKMLHEQFQNNAQARVGSLRKLWKTKKGLDMDALSHPILFRVICSYLDQGISIWRFPEISGGFLKNLKALESTSYVSLFQGKTARKFLLNEQWEIEFLLQKVIGNEELYERYLIDQQFAHSGWSGMVSTVEAMPETLLDKRRIALKELIAFELLVEIDVLESKMGEDFSPMSKLLEIENLDLFAPIPYSEHFEVIRLWQNSYEWHYYDSVLTGLKQNFNKKHEISHSQSFQVLFCIDDRECSIRRHLEIEDPNCKTFGTPGFFGVEFFYQPENGKFYTKHCPAPVTPKFLIKETDATQIHKRDLYFHHQTHSLLFGWLISQSLGFWSAMKLFVSIFRPTMSPATASSLKHMDEFSALSIEFKGETENGLQVGYKVEEMADRIETLLRSIGLVENFAPIVYLIGHGSSSVNNPHYAAYDCGACSGRPGSVNARVMSFIGNHPGVREILAERGINITQNTQFVGGLQDTTRDEIVFYDEDTLTAENKKLHAENKQSFRAASDMNALERSRRFELVDTLNTPEKVHEKVKLRSVSLFEPRPELNHATNTLCIVGGRELTKNVFLDRRAFMNSYSYKVDPDGKYLFGILKACAPVCGGINLEYYFSRVDNQNLGAGSKLPHNVMGLFGVANGIDGDLRPGLPSQMIEVHDPIRLLIIVEHFPKVVLETIRKDANTYEWFKNNWVHLVVLNPETKTYFKFQNEAFEAYEPVPSTVEIAKDLLANFRNNHDNLPVYLMN
jgi:uncharacterized protein YbcC (UPF0753/DUF2309 family)